MFSITTPILAALLAFVASSAHAGQEAIGEPNVTWTKRKIHVCWKNGVYQQYDYLKNDLKEEYKKAVQQIVEQEYSIEKVGITFYGWEDCSCLNPSDYDIEIIQDNEKALSNPMVEEFRKLNAEGYSTLGQGSLEQISTVSDKLTKKVISQKRGYLNRNITMPRMYLMARPDFRAYFDSFHAIEELQLTALHEFGHAAGLRHEHIREEAKTDPNCLNRQDKNVEILADTAVILESYDPNSIMNYCWSSTLLQMGTRLTTLPNIPDTTLYTVNIDPKTKFKTYQVRIGLSAKDISTLNKLYPKQND